MLLALSNSQLVLESGGNRVDFPSEGIAAIRCLLRGSHELRMFAAAELG